MNKKVVFEKKWFLRMYNLNYGTSNIAQKKTIHHVIIKLF